MRFWRTVESSQELFLMSFFSSSGCTCQQCCNRICLDTAFLWSDQHPAWAKMERDSCASVTHLKTILVDERLDAIISGGINIPRRSMKWLPLLFYELNIASAGDREKAFNPDIIEWKEDHSRWYYSHPLQNSRVRLWTLFTCEKVALKSRLSPKCARNVFWNQSWFQRWLDIKVKFHESNKSQGCFISVSESPCSNYPPPIVVEILHKQKPHV